MHLHPDLMLSLAHDRQRDLMEQAGKARLLSAARRARRAARKDAAAKYSPVARGRPSGSLAPCERRVVA